MITDVEKMIEISFFVPMIPRSNERHRTNLDGRKYTPKTTENARGIVKFYCEQAMKAIGIDKPMDRFFTLHLDIQIDKPKNWYEGKPPFAGGDTDNHIKLVKDALQGTLYSNDNRVTSESGRKTYSDKPGYEITFYCYEILQKPKKERIKKTVTIGKNQQLINQYRDEIINCFKNGIKIVEIAKCFKINYTILRRFRVDYQNKLESEVKICE